jgi:hypothetical protein
MTSASSVTKMDKHSILSIVRFFFQSVVIIRFLIFAFKTNFLCSVL